MNNTTLEKISYYFLKAAKFFVKLAIFCVIIYLIGMRLFNFGYRLFYEKSLGNDTDSEEIVFEIKSGDTVDVIAKNLEKAGLIDDTLAFKFRSKIYKTNFTPNVYILKTSMTIKNMLDIFDSPTSDDIIVTQENGEAGGGGANNVYQLSPEEEQAETTEDDIEME